jgi:glycosyltransferase involved in cell wall biosynthesis
VSLNSAGTIADCLESVRRQTHPDIEHIVVDGMSDDGTREIIERYDPYLARAIVEPDNGIYDAMNKGIRAATGDVVGILNADDMMQSPDTVATIAEAFQAGWEAVYGDLVIVRRHRPDEVLRYVSGRFFATWMVRFGLMVPHPTFYARRELFQRFGEYRTDYRVAADFELLARFFAGKVRPGYIPQVLVRMRAGGISTSGIYGRIHQNFEIVRACRSNGIRTAIPLLLAKLPIKALEYLLRKRRLARMANP